MANVRGAGYVKRILAMDCKQKVKIRIERKPGGDIHTVSSKVTPKGITGKVWRIFNFESRFVLPDDVRKARKGPLEFMRGIINGGRDNNTATYFRQMEILRSRPNRLKLRGAFEDIKEIAAGRCGNFRGYLINSNWAPASNKVIATWLGVTTREATKILKQLGDIGLIERVDMPDLSAAGNAKTAGGKAKKASEKTAKE